MAKYKVVGPRTVADTAPGHTVELDLPEANITALIKAGHIIAEFDPILGTKEGSDFLGIVREPSTPDPGVPEKQPRKPRKAVT